MACTLQEWAEQGLVPKFTLWNKQNPVADPVQCGRYRVDFVFEWEEGVVLLEYDEQMHSDRDRRCELVRQAEVSLGYGGRPVHWIRFNPDAFKVGGCTRKTGKKERDAALLEQLRAHVLKADYAHLITIDYVCYDPQPHASNSPSGGAWGGLVQTLRFDTIEAYCAWADGQPPASAHAPGDDDDEAGDDTDEAGDDAEPALSGVPP